jgi:hypothetical protein
MMTDHRVNITVDRVLEMDDREMYNVSDCYVKGRLSRFEVDPDDQKLLAQRELPKSQRDLSLADTAEVFDSVKRQLHNVLYTPYVLPRHHFALSQMKKSVQDQLENNEDITGDWRRSARSFLDMVKDEIFRAEIVMQEHQERSARRHLAMLLDAVRDHRDADEDDVEDADERLYAVADQIAEDLLSQAAALHA